MQQITIRIKKNGSTTVETEGFQGGECKEITKELLEQLGNVTDEKLKAEFYETPLTNIELQ